MNYFVGHHIFAVEQKRDAQQNKQLQLFEKQEFFLRHPILLHNSVANLVAISLHVYEHHLTCSNTNIYTNTVFQAFSNASSHECYYIVILTEDNL
jgi:hypothetical protein